MELLAEGLEKICQAVRNASRQGGSELGMECLRRARARLDEIDVIIEHEKKASSLRLALLHLSDILSRLPQHILANYIIPLARDEYCDAAVPSLDARSLGLMWDWRGVGGLAATSKGYAEVLRAFRSAHCNGRRTVHRAPLACAPAFHADSKQAQVCKVVGKACERVLVAAGVDKAAARVLGRVMGRSVFRADMQVLDLTYYDPMRSIYGPVDVQFYNRVSAPWFDFSFHGARESKHAKHTLCYAISRLEESPLAGVASVLRHQVIPGAKGRTARECLLPAVVYALCSWMFEVQTHSLFITYFHDDLGPLADLPACVLGPPPAYRLGNLGRPPQLEGMSLSEMPAVCSTEEGIASDDEQEVLTAVDTRLLNFRRFGLENCFKIDNVPALEDRNLPPGATWESWMPVHRARVRKLMSLKLFAVARGRSEANAEAARFRAARRPHPPSFPPQPLSPRSRYEQLRAGF